MEDDNCRVAIVAWAVAIASIVSVVMTGTLIQSIECTDPTRIDYGRPRAMFVDFRRPDVLRVDRSGGLPVAGHDSAVERGGRSRSADRPAHLPETVGGQGQRELSGRSKRCSPARERIAVAVQSYAPMTF
jgi:hypothetical protein